MKKSNFKPDGARVVKREMALEVRNVMIHQAAADGSFKAGMGDSPFGGLGYTPDRWKAYMEFDICAALPAITGPVSEGFFVGYTPQTLAMSHQSLLHQQVNLNHILKAYESEDGKKGDKDRIVGCVVATYFPKPPMDGWKIGDDPGAAPAIRGMAVIFKLADGVNRVMGDHQTSRKKQSLSIEAITSLDNIGIYLPGRGADKIVPITAIAEHDPILESLELNPMKLGKVNGEQGVFVFGMGRPIELRGVGITPRPAEETAKIVSFDAKKQEIDGGTMFALAASQVDQELQGRAIKFKSTGRKGVVTKVFTEGKAKLPGYSWGIAATAQDPVLDIELPDKRHVLRTVSSLGAAIAKP